MTALELHVRLGHLNFADAIKLAERDGINITHKDKTDCVPCLLGKSHRHGIPDVAQDRSTRTEILFHVDILPFEEVSLEGFHHAAVFVLDQSRYTRVYGLSAKSDMTSALGQFIQDLKSRPYLCL